MARFTIQTNMPSTYNSCLLMDQLLSAIKDVNCDQFHLGLINIALAQEPPIDLNQICSNGHTLLTFAGWFDFSSCQKFTDDIDMIFQ